MNTDDVKRQSAKGKTADSAKDFLSLEGEDGGEGERTNRQERQGRQELCHCEGAKRLRQSSAAGGLRSSDFGSSFILPPSSFRMAVSYWEALPVSSMLDFIEPETVGPLCSLMMVSMPFSHLGMVVEPDFQCFC